MLDAMTKPPIKLFTAKTWAAMLTALLAGSSLPLYREYRATGMVKVSSLVISLITFLVGVAICSVVAWWGNRPEKGDNSDRK